MTSTRHAIVALTLPFGLGAAAFAAGSFVGFVVALVLLLAFVGVEVARWEIRQRRAEVVRRANAQRTAGPLLNRNSVYDPDAYFDQVTRRWAG